MANPSSSKLLNMKIVALWVASCVSVSSALPPVCDNFDSSISTVGAACTIALETFTAAVNLQTSVSVWDQIACESAYVKGVPLPTNYQSMNLAFQATCCPDFTTACDKAAAVPTMCKNNDESSTSTCKLLKSTSVLELLPSSAFTVNSWDETTCATTLLGTGTPVNINMAAYAASCCQSGVSACPLPAPPSVPPVCSAGANDFLSTSTSCIAALTTFELAAALETNKVTEWTAETCDQVFAPATESTPAVTNFAAMDTAFVATPQTSCCASGLSTCDMKKTIPTMCGQGDSDVINNSLCILSKYALELAFPSVSYPFTSWTQDTCNAQVSVTIPSAPTVTGPAYFIMATYAQTCCTSKQSACTVKPCPSPKSSTSSDGISSSTFWVVVGIESAVIIGVAVTAAVFVFKQRRSANVISEESLTGKLLGA